MTQWFEIFKGAPDDLVARLFAIKAGGGTAVTAMLTTASANYLITYTAAAAVP